ncbi:hypothetical protein [uncultured Shewanella sp.]|uniref:hypothetical protein n=1 Tax=uncultured Shewanella sp. TaxID=173975 RepID=UPI0026347D4B|nr:hypothetical protein [uncultured Shewanella sp.]
MGNNINLATACEVPTAKSKGLTVKNKGLTAKNKGLTAKQGVANKHKLHVVKPAQQNSQLHTDRQQVWNVLRIHNKANKRLIMTTTSVKSGLIYRYLTQLVKSGYLKALNPRKGRPRGQCIHYRLIRNSGRLAPQVRNNGVYDQNQQVFYPFNNKEAAK